MIVSSLCKQQNSTAVHIYDMRELHLNAFQAPKPVLSLECAIMHVVPSVLHSLLCKGPCEASEVPEELWKAVQLIWQIFLTTLLLW